MGQGVARVLRDRLLVGTPLVLAVALSAVHLPGILMRFDDGHRGARLIDANGVRLVWAPAGPGWNWRQEERVDRGLGYFKSHFPSCACWQVTMTETRDRVTADGIRIAPAVTLLRDLV